MKKKKRKNLIFPMIGGLILVIAAQIALFNVAEKLENESTSWDVSVLVDTNGVVSLQTSFNVLEIPALILPSGESVNDQIGDMQRQAIYNPSNNTVNFSLSIDYDGQTHATNGTRTLR